MTTYKKTLPKTKRDRRNSPATVAAWKEHGAPNLSAQRWNSATPSMEGPGRPSEISSIERWVETSMFSHKHGQEVGLEGNEASRGRRLVDHDPGTWRLLECRMYHLGHIHHLSDAEISARLDLALEDFSVVRSIAGSAQLPRLRRKEAV